MNMDLSVELMHATVQLEQPLGNGTRTVGTGFLISDTAPDGRPRTVLVTANHVFKGMPGEIARIGYREGKFGQLDLLEAERTLGETRSAAIDALAAFHIAKAQLDRLTASAKD